MDAGVYLFRSFSDGDFVAVDLGRTAALVAFHRQGYLIELAQLQTLLLPDFEVDHRGRGKGKLRR